MGTKVIPPEPDPVECLQWDPPSDTPKYIYCLFEGIKLGDNPAARDFPNGHIFKLTKELTRPCGWEYNDPVFKWKINLKIWPDWSELDAVDSDFPARSYFRDWAGPSPVVEYLPYVNSHDSKFEDWGWDGIGLLFWNDPFVAVPVLLGIDTFPDLMLEVFTDDAGDTYLKYCSIRFGLNITVKIPQ